MPYAAPTEYRSGTQRFLHISTYKEEQPLANWTETTANIAGTELALVKGGSGKPLLMFHDELGYPGWIRSYRDLGGFYARVVREMNLDPVDVIGFSAGGFIAAEMAASDPKIFSRMILVAPMGLKPTEGEILDIFPLTIRAYLRATVADTTTSEFGKIYGGEMTPEQFEAFEDARAETARIGWEPYMHNPSLGYLLEGVKNLPTLLVWGQKDTIVPKGCIEAYRKAIAGAKVAEITGAGHRPEIENSDEFVRAVRAFLAA
jgi:pimeloyl-ACP methyl ester carboxylesterase